MTNESTKHRTYTPYKYADEKQKELYKLFPPDTLLGSETFVDHFLLWMTFFRRNFHRFALDYLMIKLHLYQVIMLYIMGINNFIVVVASRASAKSFIIALYACIRCILYPNSLIVLSSATLRQSKLLVSEKIQKELMNMSPMLKKEIADIKSNNGDTIVKFHNDSSITVVPATENGRGYRSNCIVREEFRQIKKEVDDKILSPFQIVRQTPYAKDERYANIKELEEECVDIYITSSWLDNGHWMWKIVDNCCDGMLKGKQSCLLAFDESIALKHKIKTMRYFKNEKRKQDPISWKLEFLNLRVKENTAAFFPYSILEKNQREKKVFYPRRNEDVKAGKRNPHDIPKQEREIRVVSCDMAFVENSKNDNSIFTCMRLLPECTTYSRDESNDVIVDNGYRRKVSYIESIQGGDITKQAIRIRQLYEDFKADYIVLDTRNAGIAVYDLLAKVMYDEYRGVEYSPLSCMNDDAIANRIRIEGANPCIFAVNASQRLNSDIANDFRRVLNDCKIDLLVRFNTALEDVLPDIKEYNETPESDVQSFYEMPFLETQELVSETADLVYEKKEQTGVIVVREQGNNRKDRYTSCSYGSYFASLLEKDLVSQNEDYEFCVLIN